MGFPSLAAKRKYQREWKAQRRADFFVGKKCVKCGETKNLITHHVDKTKKTSDTFWSWAKKRREAELAKCVVWCEKCHCEHHADEWRKPLVHGTLHGYQSKKCRCELCRAANAEKSRKYRTRKLVIND